MTVWTPVPSCPGYQVDGDGRVLGKRGKVMHPSPSRGGYLQVTLHLAGKQSTRPVHLMVCEAFNGPRPSKEYDAAHGNHPRATISVGKVAELRKEAKSLATGRKQLPKASRPILALKYGITISAVKDILTCRSW